MGKIKKLISDLSLGTIGLIMMNAVLSLLIYPYLGNHLGASMQGRILFYTSLMSLMAGSLGSGANYGRMKVYAEERKTENGEYNLFLLGSLVLIIAITLIASFMKGDTAGTSPVLIILLIFLTVVRYYGDVQYRLSLNYKQFALYYIIISAGYGAGLLLYMVIPEWPLILITGELFGIVYNVLTGSVFRPPFFRKAERAGRHIGTVSLLSVSYFLSDFVASADRLLFPLLLVNGDEMTSLFYYASLVGKIMSLLSSPLNGVLSGYIARSEGGLSKKTFFRIILLMLGIFAVVTGVSVAGSHVFVYLFYHDYYQAVKPLFLLANAGQVIFFICNTMMVVVLRYTHEKNQIIVGISYIAAFFAITVPLILRFGIIGMAVGILVVNVLKFVLFSVLGYIGIGRAERQG